MADDRVKKYIEARVAEAEGEVTRHAREADGARKVLASILTRFEEAKIDAGAWRRIHNMHTRGTSPMSAQGHPGAVSGRPEPSIDQLEREQSSMSRFASPESAADTLMSAVGGMNHEQAIASHGQPTIIPPWEVEGGILHLPAGRERAVWSKDHQCWVRAK